MTVTPANGAPGHADRGRHGITRIWKGGVEAASPSVLASGQSVQVFFEGDRATKVVMAQSAASPQWSGGLRGAKSPSLF